MLEAQRSGGNSHGRGVQPQVQPLQVNHVSHKRDRSRERDNGRSVTMSRGSRSASDRSHSRAGQRPRGSRGRSGSSVRSQQRTDKLKRTTRCHNCNRVGHWASDCRQPKRQSWFEPPRGGDSRGGERRGGERHDGISNSNYGSLIVNMVALADRASSCDDAYVEWALHCGSQVNMVATSASSRRHTRTTTCSRSGTA